MVLVSVLANNIRIIIIIIYYYYSGVNGQSRHSDQDTDQPLQFQYRYNQKMAKYAQGSTRSWFFFYSSYFFSCRSGTSNGYVFYAQSSQIQDGACGSRRKIQCMLNLWVKQLSSVIDRTPCRSILAGAASLVDLVNASSGNALTSGQRDDLPPLLTLLNILIYL